MSKFYSHIVEVDSIVEALEEVNLTHSHKKELSSLVDWHIHHKIIDLILSKLSQEDKIIFLNKLENESESKEVMSFLVNRVENIEDEIKEAVNELKDELHNDIKEARRLNPKNE